jgi:hypothetical protein
MFLAAGVVALLVGIPSAYQALAQVGGWWTWRPPQVTTDAYTQLMATVAQSAAAMLALFYAAISLVASTTYAKVTTELRTLIAQDDLNRRYLRLLAHTAATATAGIGILAFGVPASPFLAGYIVVVATICFLAFLPLGIRVFALFDPSQLAGYPSRAFTQVLRIVTNSGRNWRDQSFQQHANRVAQEQLQLLDDLASFALTENRIRNTNIVGITSMVSQLARYYSVKKTTIPSDSLWFTRKAEFKRWEVSSSSMTSLALRTGVSPSPDPIPDHDFVEAQLSALTVRCLGYLLERDALDDAARLLAQINITATRYAQGFDYQNTLQLVISSREVLVHKLKSVPDKLEPLQHLQLIDIQCVAALAVILIPGLALSEPPLEQLMALHESVRTLRLRQLYTQAHPRQVLKDAEDLVQRLEFEYQTEGAITTQAWYVQQIIALSYASVVRELIKTITVALDNEFILPASELIAAQRARWAGAWLHRGIEACQKAKDRIEELERRYGELKAYHFADIPWHPSGSDEGLSKVEVSRVRIVRLLAETVPDLCAMPADGATPDLLGQARAWIAEELISMMERKQQQGFPELFLAYFNASLAIYGHFVDLAQQPGQEDFVRVAMDTILDVMDISGLAYIFSELDNNKFNKLVAVAWDAYFDRASDKAAIVRALYSSIAARFRLPILSSSAMQRQEWGRRLATAMAERGINIEHDHGSYFDRHRRAPHPSVVVESLAVMFGHPIGHPHEYFAALYIAQRAEANGIELPRSVKQCMESMERAVKRQAEYETKKQAQEPE